MSFSLEKVAQKLSQLNPTESSIVSTSQWLLFHYRNGKAIVDVWNAKFVNPATNSNEKLTLFYLCNDMIQSSRKNPKHAIFLKEFSESLPESLKVVCKTIEEPIKLKFKKVLNIWRDRQVFSPRIIQGLVSCIEVASSSAGSTLPPFEGAYIKQPKKQVTADDSYNSEKDVEPELMPANIIYGTISQTSLTSSNEFQAVSKKYTSLLKSEHLPAPHKFLKELEELSQKNEKLISNTNTLANLRGDLITDLQKLVDRQNEWIKLEEMRLQKLQEMKKVVDEKKTELKELLKDVDSTMAENGNEYANDSKASMGDNDEDDMPTYVFEDENEKNDDPNNDDDDMMPSYTNDPEADDDDDEMPSYKRAADDDDDDIPRPVVEGFSDDDEEVESTKESGLPPSKRLKTDTAKEDNSEGYSPSGSNEDQENGSSSMNTDLASILFKLT